MARRLNSHSGTFVVLATTALLVSAAGRPLERVTAADDAPPPVRINNHLPGWACTGNAHRDWRLDPLITARATKLSCNALPLRAGAPNLHPLVLRQRLPQRGPTGRVSHRSACASGAPLQSCFTLGESNRDKFPNRAPVSVPTRLTGPD